jgi:cyclopropane fatty-acyl-phospholipid synthase-like methyltransferase
LNENKYLEYWNDLYKNINYFGTGPTKLAIFASEILEKNTCSNMLEIGCGQGRDAIHFSQLGYNVHAFDISKNAVHFVNEIKKSSNLSNLEINVHNVEEPFLFESEFFDFVYSNLALQFFNLESLKKIFSNISHVTKKNSLFLMSTKKKGDKYYNFGKQISENAFENKGIIRYFYELDELKEAFSEHFDLIEYDSHQHENLDTTTSIWWKLLLKKK